MNFNSETLACECAEGFEFLGAQSPEESEDPGCVRVVYRSAPKDRLTIILLLVLVAIQFCLIVFLSFLYQNSRIALRKVSQSGCPPQVT